MKKSLNLSVLIVTVYQACLDHLDLLEKMASLAFQVQWVLKVLKVLQDQKGTQVNLRYPEELGEDQLTPNWQVVMVMLKL